MDIDYWKSYYETHPNVPKHSLFAEFVKTRFPNLETVLDFGCGSGRDTYFFGKDSFAVGLDTAVKPVDKDRASFIKAPLSAHEPTCKYELIYSRFSLHSISEEEENDFLEFASLNGVNLAIECRTNNDDLAREGKDRVKTDYADAHYRRYINLNNLLKKVIDKGFTIMYCEESKEFAPYKGTKPSCLRLIANIK